VSYLIVWLGYCQEPPFRAIYLLFLGCRIIGISGCNRTERRSSVRNMKAVFLILAVVVLFWSFSCSKKEEPKPAAAVETNPFFTEWTAPFGTPRSRE